MDTGDPALRAFGTPACKGTRAGFSQVIEPMSTNAAVAEKSVATQPNPSSISGPHPAWDATGEYYEFYACENCTLESTDRRMQDGCLRCGGA